MAKKPGSWKKISELTGKARPLSKNGKMRMGIFSTLFIAGAAAFTTTSYFFVTEIINYNGIKTHGQLPSWNFDKGNGFEIDFAKTPMNLLEEDQQPFERIVVEATPDHVKYEKVEATSLRLQYAYNDVFERAPKDFITSNPIYRVSFPNENLIEIVDIYTDIKLTNKLSIDDVQQNNFDVFNCVLFLKINYDNKPVSNALLMPTIFYGNEGFLSNFLQFNLLNNLHKNDTGSTALHNQSAILGEQANKILMEIDTDNLDSNGRANYTDELYDTYDKIFDLFFKENQGINKEFTYDIANPYSNFVISGAHKNDSFLVDYNFDSTEYLFDINQIFAMSSPINKNKSIDANQDFSDVKHLLPLITFLKNIYVESDGEFAIPRDFLKSNNGYWWWETILDAYDLDASKDNLNRYVTSSIKNDNKYDDQYYFMFLPTEIAIQDLFMNLKSDFHSMVDKAMNGNFGDISDLLVESFNRIKKNLTKYGSNSKYWWLFDFAHLPFQTYWNTESMDGKTITKDRHLQHISPTNNDSIIIDTPSLHEIVNSKTTTYDMSDGGSRNKLFSDLWSASAIFNDDGKNPNWNVIEISKESETIDEDIFNLVANHTYYFAKAIDDKYPGMIENLPSEVYVWQELIKEEYDMNVIPLDKFNKPINEENPASAFAVDLVGYFNKKQVQPNLQKITFRMKIHWV